MKGSWKRGCDFTDVLPNSLIIIFTKPIINVKWGGIVQNTIWFPMSVIYHILLSSFYHLLCCSTPFHSHSHFWLHSISDHFHIHVYYLPHSSLFPVAHVCFTFHVLHLLSTCSAYLSCAPLHTTMCFYFSYDSSQVTMPPYLFHNFTLLWFRPILTLYINSCIL